MLLVWRLWRWASFRDTELWLRLDPVEADHLLTKVLGDREVYGAWSRSVRPSGEDPVKAEGAPADGRLWLEVLRGSYGFDFEALGVI